MPRIRVTHENFDTLLEQVKKGVGLMFIPTAYKIIVINKKACANWEKAGSVVIKKDKDGNGFRIGRRSDRYDYVFSGQLFYEKEC